MGSSQSVWTLDAVRFARSNTTATATATVKAKIHPGHALALMSSAMDRPTEVGDIANHHPEAPDHHVPLDHLRSLYYRPALGSGILVPSSELTLDPSDRLSDRPNQDAASSHASTASRRESTSSPWQSHTRTDSNASRIARAAAASSFWSPNVANSHPGSHASILAQAQAQAHLQAHSPPASQGSPALSQLTLKELGATSAFPLPSSVQPRQLSYIHAAPGSRASSCGLGIGRMDAHHGLLNGASSSYGYLPTRVLPVEEKKRILVTGGAGFVGSHLVDRLMLMGHEVLVIDNFYTGQKSNVSQWVGHPNFELIRHDVVEPLVIEVDQIYHLACPASPISYQANQIKTIKTNFLGTLNALGLAKRTKARFLLASTSEVYGDPDVHPQPETYNGNVNPVGPRACYDEGKRVAETLTYGYYYQDGVDVRVARIFNTYGPRMHPHDGRVVSNLILQALRGEPLTVFGDGTQTRSFMFIHDLIDGLISLMNVESLPADDAPPSRATPDASAVDIMTEAPDSIIPTRSTVATPAADEIITAASTPALGDSYFDPTHVHRFDVHTPVNLGNPAEFTIMELAHLVQVCVHKVKAQDTHASALAPGEQEAKSEIRFFAMPKDDPKQRKPDITRATGLLDWHPRWKLQDGLEEMTRWYWERIKEGSL